MGRDGVGWMDEGVYLIQLKSVNELQIRRPKAKFT